MSSERTVAGSMLSNADKVAMLLNECPPQGILDKLHRNLFIHHPKISALAPDATNRITKFLNIMTDGWTIGHVPDEGGFIVDHERKQIILNEAPILLIAQGIIRQMADGESFSSCCAAFEIVVMLYALHEGLHPSQGLILLDHVRDLKALASVTALAEFDIEADMDAARVLSAINTATTGACTRLRYLDTLKNVLITSNRIAPSIFKAPSHKPHKQARFLGLALSAMLIHRNLEKNFWEFETEFFPLDAPIFPYVDRESGRVLLRLVSLRQRMIGISKVKPSNLKSLLDEIDEAPVQKTLQGADIVLDNVEFVSVESYISGLARRLPTDVSTGPGSVCA